MADNGENWADETGHIRWKRFRTTVNNLRLATNYTVQVQPIHQISRSSSASASSAKVFTIQTKGCTRRCQPQDDNQ